MFCGHSVCCNWSSRCCFCCCWFVVLFACSSHACHVLRFDVVPARSPCLNKLKVIKTSKAKAKAMAKKGEKKTQAEKENIANSRTRRRQQMLLVHLAKLDSAKATHTHAHIETVTHRHTAQVCKYFMQKHKQAHTHKHASPRPQLPENVFRHICTLASNNIYFSFTHTYTHTHIAHCYFLDCCNSGIRFIRRLKNLTQIVTQKFLLNSRQLNKFLNISS